MGYTMSYAIKEVKQVCSAGAANRLLAGGWLLLDVYHDKGTAFYILGLPYTSKEVYGAIPQRHGPARQNQCAAPVSEGQVSAERSAESSVENNAESR